MKLGRREFLVAAAAATFVVYGLDRLGLAHDEAPAAKRLVRPEYVNAALAEMKATANPGIWIVLPADKDARDAVRAEIETLLRNPSPKVKTLLVEAVYVAADGCFIGASPGETLVLVGPEGVRLSGSSAKLTSETFAEAVRPLLRDGDRLAKRAKAARTPRVEKLFAELDGKDAERVETAVQALVAEFAAAGPAVIESFEASPSASEAWTLRARVIGEAFRLRRGGEMSGPGRPLPFGTKWTSPKEPEIDSCPACGMMMRMDRARDTLELLAKTAPTVK